ncbi:MAG: hypothetical protein ACO3MW_02660 [Rhodospirillales bacterium]
MVGNTPPEFLADLVMNVTLQNGVFRITLGQVDSNNRAVPVTRLLVPANQLPKMISGLANASKKIATQLRERAEDAQNKAEGKEENTKKAAVKAQARPKAKPANNKKK